MNIQTHCKHALNIFIYLLEMFPISGVEKSEDQGNNGNRRATKFLDRPVNLDREAFYYSRNASISIYHSHQMYNFVRCPNRYGVGVVVYEPVDRRSLLRSYISQ